MSQFTLKYTFSLLCFCFSSVGVIVLTLSVCVSVCVYVCQSHTTDWTDGPTYRLEWHGGKVEGQVKVKGQRSRSRSSGHNTIYRRFWLMYWCKDLPTKRQRNTTWGVSKYIVACHLSSQDLQVMVAWGHGWRAGTTHWLKPPTYWATKNTPNRILILALERVQTGHEVFETNGARGVTLHTTVLVWWI